MSFVVHDEAYARERRTPGWKVWVEIRFSITFGGTRRLNWAMSGLH